MSAADSGAALPRRPLQSEPGANPFATRFIRSGAVPYLFPPGESAESCVKRLALSDWRGQIVGPHGSGKSTLVETLIPLLVERGRRVQTYQLHDGQRRLPRSVDPSSWTDSSLIVVDGYEQLSVWSRWRLQRSCRRARAGLLITCHDARHRLPIVFQTSTDPSLLLLLVNRLVAGVPNEKCLAPEQVRQAFVDQRGNLREALLQLYDVWEASSEGSSE